MQLTTDLGNNAVQLFEKEGVVCPASLHHSLFTTGNLDTIDHDHFSTSAKTSFHGTAISLTQHPPESNTALIRRHEQVTHDDTLKDQTIKPLPETHTVVNPGCILQREPSTIEDSGLPGTR